MKHLMLITAAAALLGTSAYAQDSRPTPRDGMQAPSYTQGSGQRSGGPAAELNSPTGAPASGVTVTGPATTGSTRGEVDIGNTRQAPATQGGSQVPSFQTGSGQQSGGPAKELNTQTGIPGRQ